MTTILVIEPDPATLLTLSLVLRCFGYEVLEAYNKGEAWGVCAERQEPIHVIMTNKALHDSPGEFISRFQFLHPQIRVLFVSDASSPTVTEPQDIPCIYAVLSRPFRADALVDTIRRLLDRPQTRVISCS